MKVDVKKYEGIFVAFYGCYNESGEISTFLIRQLVQYYKKAGVQGLYLTGSSGECMLQSVNERNTIVQTVIEEANHELTVIVHSGAANTKDSVSLSAFAAKAGADAISSVPNVYYPIPEACIESHWDKMMDAAQLPFIIYNIPQTTGYNLSQKMFEKMLCKEYVIGIKNTTPSSAQINQYRRLAGDDFVIYNGPDNQLLAGLILGANGGIGGTYGCMPELYVKLYEAYSTENIKTARLWQNRINSIIDKMQQFPYTTGLSAARSITEARGIKIGQVRNPILSVPINDPIIQNCANQIEDWLL